MYSAGFVCFWVSAPHHSAVNEQTRPVHSYSHETSGWRVLGPEDLAVHSCLNSLVNSWRQSKQQQQQTTQQANSTTERDHPWASSFWSHSHFPQIVLSKAVCLFSASSLTAAHYCWDYSWRKTGRPLQPQLDLSFSYLPACKALSSTSHPNSGF